MPEFDWFVPVLTTDPTSYFYFLSLELGENINGDILFLLFEEEYCLTQRSISLSARIIEQHEPQRHTNRL